MNDGLGIDKMLDLYNVSRYFEKEYNCAHNY